MNMFIVIVLVLIALETTYLAYKTIPKQNIPQRSMLIDTSVLIDGRILPIARSQLITAPLIIPRSVVRELQYMADKADHDKRERAREGLDMIEQLQRIEDLTLNVIDDHAAENGVDEQLVELAKRYGARLCTVDYNLNKAARAQGVDVININELAHALRIIHLPGEVITLTLVQPGQESRQAVGYLDDGTMVVVDDAKALMHQDVEAEITRVLQTSAGKMMFAKLVSKKQASQTRGEAEGGSRMGAIKRSASQTRGEAESRMIADKNQQVRATKTKSWHAHKLNDNRDSSPENNSFAPETSKSERRHRRRQTPEDKLVNLANND